MITLHKSKFTAINYEKFLDPEDKNSSLQNYPLKVEEMQSMSDGWYDDPEQFPEMMFHIFRTFLKEISTVEKHITFFDIGAAEGAWSCSILEYFNSFDILAVEPDLPRLGQFVKNLEASTKKFDIDPNTANIDLFECLISDGLQETEFLRHYTCLQFGGHAGSSRIFKADQPNRIGTDLEYEALPLDTFIEQYDEVDIIKIDVEGAELKVLAGAKKFIEKFKPIIFLEVHGGFNHGSVSISQIKDIFDTYDIDYKFNLIESQPGPGELPFLTYYICVPPNSQLIFKP